MWYELETCVAHAVSTDFSEISCTEAVCHDGTPTNTAGVQQVLRLFTVS